MSFEPERLYLFISVIPCTTNSDCPDHLACGEDEECVAPPCPDCAANAHCEGSNHVGICICDIGYVGDPYSKGCEEHGNCSQKIHA